MAEPDSQKDEVHGEFRFVSELNGRVLRSHAMRAHWRGRKKRAGSRSGGVGAQRQLRPLLPLQRDKQGSAPAIDHVEDTQDAGRSASPPHRQLPDAGDPESSPQEPYVILCSPSSDQLDPFDSFPVRLTREHHKLLHHWLTTGTTTMFDNLPPSMFSPVRDVWLPLDLSNAASFNACMAHLAAHLSLVRGQGCSIRALEFKIEAMRIVSEWMADQNMALSDDVFAGVSRLLAYERYWGTESEWEIRHGNLMQMIGARGGVGAFAGNWRLALVLYLTTLMARPSWFDCSNRIRELVMYQSLFPLQFIVGDDSAPHRIRCLWLLSLVQDMEHFALSSMNLYRSLLANHANLQDALVLLKLELEQYDLAGLRGACIADAEYRRLACVFFIAILCRGSTAAPFDALAAGHEPEWVSCPVAIISLDAHLMEYRDSWCWDVDGLYTTLYSGFFTVDDGIPDRDYVLSMTSVLGSMNSAARRGVERCLLHMLCQKPPAWTECPLEDWATYLPLSNVQGQ